MLTDEIIDCLAAGLAALQGEEPLTIDSPMEDIAEVEGGYELLSTCIGALVDTILSMAGEYSFPEAMANPQAAGILTQEMQDCIEDGLAALQGS